MLDIALAITAMVGAFLGWRLGMIRPLVALVGAGTGIVLAKYHAFDISHQLGQVVDDERLAYTISFVAVAVAVTAMSIALGIVVRRLLKFVFLGWVDGVAGAAAGLVLVVAVWSVGLHFAEPSFNDRLNRAVDGSPLVGTMLREAPKVFGAVPGVLKGYATDRVRDLQDGIDISK